MSVLLITAFTGCKKEVRSQSGATADSELSDYIKRTVTEYLNNQKLKQVNNATMKTGSGSDNIDLLTQNLDFSLGWKEPFNAKFDLLVIPVRDSIIFKKSLNKSSTLEAVFFTDKYDKIYFGDILYFLPLDNIKRAFLPHNTFSNMLINRTGSVDGDFNILTLTGRWISTLEFKNGQMHSVGNVVRKNTNGKISAKMAGCTDWYLVTTYYWSDGTTTQEEQYLGTTCDGCDDPMYMSLCPDGGGGSSSPYNTVTEDVTYTDSETSFVSDDYADNPSGYKPITYTYHAKILWDSQTQEVVDVIFDPIVVTPTQDVYTVNNIAVTRYLTAFGQTHSYLYLGNRSVQLNWGCLVHARYSYSSGSETSRQWSVNKSEVRVY